MVSENGGVDDGQVVKVDFGKERRDAARTLAKLLGMLEEQEADILRDPLKYLQIASTRITDYQLVLHIARDALRVPLIAMMDEIPSRLDFDTIRVPKAEWERLQACADIVRRFMDNPR